MPLTATSRLVAPKRLIFGPGPAMVEPRAYEAMAQPVTGIRDPFFLGVMAEIRTALRPVFGTENQKTFTVPASGSGAMEAAVAGFVVPGSKFGVFTAGYFADRIATIGKRHGAIVARCEKAPGEVFSEQEAADFIERERPDAVAFVQAETSTGAFQSGKAITGAARRAGALVIADCVASLGAMPVDIDANGIDVAYSCSQKGLSCPAGLSPISISPKAWEWLEQRTTEPGSWYLDLRLIAKYAEAPHVYHHTPSPPLYYALHQGLAAMEEEGLRERYERHRRAGLRMLAALEKLGFESLVRNPADRTWHLAVVKPPAGVDEAALRDRLLQKYDVEIAGGLAQLAGKVLRIGTMGPLADEEKVDFLAAAIRESI